MNTTMHTDLARSYHNSQIINAFYQPQATTRQRQTVLRRLQMTPKPQHLVTRVPKKPH